MHKMGNIWCVIDSNEYKYAVLSASWQGLGRPAPESPVVRLCVWGEGVSKSMP